MSNNNNAKILSDLALVEMERMARRLDVGGDLAPIEDRFEYERGIEVLEPADRALVEELTRFADLCRYFSERNEKLGPEIMNEITAFAKMPLPERIEAVRAINQKLMERVQDAGPHSQFRI